MAAVMNLLKRIVVSSMRIKVLCFLLLFAVSIVIENDNLFVVVQGQATTEIRNQQPPQHELYSSSVPNGEKNTRISINDRDLLPWYKDFINLPSDVPWPGSAWLDRMNHNSRQKTTTIINDNTTSTLSSLLTSDHTTFIWEGIEYTNVYSALLQNEPLKYPCRNFNAYLNSIFISNEMAVRLVHATQSLEYAHYIMCYIRNFIGAMLVYYGTAGIFHYFCYVHPISLTTFAHRIRPSTSTIIHQITLAQGSLFLYVLLPVVDEYAVEQNWTQTYFTISEIGGIHMYLLFLVLYFSLVEIGIYWMHRTLHTNKFLYKYIHMKHHQYNKAETLTPWASIAFHPLDGILQASPYFVVIFFVPCHYLTHVIMLFFTAIWATYIHDAMDWNIDPIMGSKYHTVHHTHYIYNYGQVFTFCDYIWGTLRVPLEPTGSTKQRLLKFD